MTPLQEKFSRAVAMIEGVDNPVRDYVLALFTNDQGPQVGIVPKPSLMRNAQPLDPHQQGFAAGLLSQAHAIMRGPDE